jgi:transcriptional regulator with XRE-family HTH domain
VARVSTVCGSNPLTCGLRLADTWGMPDEAAPLTANQLVGYNLSRIRKALGLSQEEAAGRLAPYLPGKRWSRNVYSAAERSYDGKRIRQFTGDELLAMALAFGVPVGYFLVPPPPKDRVEGALLRSGKTDVTWLELWEALLGGLMSAAMFHRAMELPAGERPPANTTVGLRLGQLSTARVSVWQEPPPPYGPDDSRLRVAHDGRDDA